MEKFFKDDIFYKYIHQYYFLKKITKLHAEMKLLQI